MNAQRIAAGVAVVALAGLLLGVGLPAVRAPEPVDLIEIRTPLRTAVPERDDDDDTHICERADHDIEPDVDDDGPDLDDDGPDLDDGPAVDGPEVGGSPAEVCD